MTEISNGMNLLIDGKSRINVGLEPQKNEFQSPETGKLVKKQTLQKTLGFNKKHR